MMWHDLVGIRILSSSIEEPVDGGGVVKYPSNQIKIRHKKKKKKENQPPLLPPTLQILRIFPQCQDLHKSTPSSSDFGSFCIFFQAKGFL
jgi:hypothetical protein